MIPHDFEYHRPRTAGEAVQTFRRLSDQQKETLYCGGGTEIIAMARLLTIRPGAVIDIKAIPECQAMERLNGELIFGAGLTLSQITEANWWPLLSQTAGRVADHTARCKITLGGNIAGQIPYREALLPFLLVDARAVVVTGEGEFREAPLSQLFDQHLRLGPGEFLAQLKVAEHDTTLPHMHVKRTRLDWIAYPLFTLCALKKEGRVRFAFAGLCDFAFRSTRVEEALNQSRSPSGVRIQQALAQLPGPIVSDQHGSAEYRAFVLQNTVRDVLLQLEGA